MGLSLPIFVKYGPYLTGQTNNIMVRSMAYSNAEVSTIRDGKKQFFHFLRFGMLTHFIKGHNQVAEHSSDDFQIGAGFEK